MHYYTSGRVALLDKLGLDASAFTQFAQQDDTEQFTDQNATPQESLKNVDKTPNWGGQNSLEAGDAGTRNSQMGLPRSGGV